MADNPHPEYKQAACALCKQGIPMPIQGSRCTAPSVAQYIEQLTARVAELEATVKQLAEFCAELNDDAEHMSIQRDDAKAENARLRTAMTEALDYIKSRACNASTCGSLICAEGRFAAGKLEAALSPAPAEAQDDPVLSDDYWDQHALSCGSCSVEILTRKGDFSKNKGLSDPGDSEDEALCGWCAGAQMYIYMEQLEKLQDDPIRKALKVKCRHCKQQVDKIWNSNADEWRVAVHLSGGHECPMSEATINPGGGQIPDASRVRSNAAREALKTEGQ